MKIGPTQRSLLKLLLLLIAALGAFGSRAISSVPLRNFVLLASGVYCLGYLIHDVVQRRRSGQNWNDALAGGTKLVTGNVWLDGILFAAIVLTLAIAAFLLIYYSL
jgi:uncharacterized membrane protein HdeD (DUF308 family)